MAVISSELDVGEDVIVIYKSITASLSIVTNVLNIYFKINFTWKILTQFNLKIIS